MNRRHLMAAGAVAAAALPLAARAQESAVAADGTLDPEKAPAILNGNFAKVTSQLALERAENESVRTFAELEATEQTAVAAAFGVPADAPPQIPESKAAALEALEAAEGAEFDRLYVEGQIAGHEELRGIHADYAENGSDPMARGASMVGVPSIDTHLVLLRSIQSQIG